VQRAVAPPVAWPTAPRSPGLTREDPTPIPLGIVAGHPVPADPVAVGRSARPPVALTTVPGPTPTPSAQAPAGPVAARTLDPRYAPVPQARASDSVPPPPPPSLEPARLTAQTAATGAPARAADKATVSPAQPGSSGIRPSVQRTTTAVSVRSAARSSPGRLGAAGAAALTLAEGPAGHPRPRGAPVTVLRSPTANGGTLGPRPTAHPAAEVRSDGPTARPADTTGRSDDPIAGQAGPTAPARPRPGVRIAPRRVIAPADLGVPAPARFPSLQRSPESRASVTGPAKAQRIADATGATREIGPAGDPTLSFLAPLSAERTIAGGQTPPVGFPAPASPTAAVPARETRRREPADHAEIDELYDHLVERLRRDHLIERERSAGLALDLY
jgi:hypothetical protein